MLYWLDGSCLIHMVTRPTKSLGWGNIMLYYLARGLHDYLALLLELLNPTLDLTLTLKKLLILALVRMSNHDQVLLSSS